jgi:membrane-bound lytic murein transglycosylase D
MEEIFRREGLPVELTRLPLIESCFNLRAYSKAAAAGIWQFIPATGRLYMRIDGVIDERRDPLLSTRAAARLLKANYAMLGSWPLAITAYNHGPYGMSKAVETLGTRDIAEIIRRYRGKSFGFASKNFYPEFLAALEVERDHQQHFGPLRMEPPLRYEEVRVKDSIPLRHLAHCANTDEQQIRLLNPALQRAYAPGGYRLRVPVGASQQFAVRYAALPVQEKAPRAQAVRVAAKSRRAQAVRVASKSRRVKAAYTRHKVRRGQTLHTIAQQYNTTITSLKRLNGVSKVKRLQIGQTLRVPTS